MKYFIITSSSIDYTGIGKIAVMKNDWASLTVTQRSIMLQNMLLNGVSLSQYNKDRIGLFVQNGNLDGNVHLELGAFEINRVDKGTMLEFILVSVVEHYSHIKEVNEEEYNRFLEDAIDEETK